MARWYDNDWSYFPPSKPREAKGGIKARSKRGDFGESWWAKRWLQVLESFHMGARLDRGRNYARKGQVLSIDVGKGLVRSRVQGSRPKPYDVAIQVRPLSEEDWKKLVEALSRQAIFAAKLLSGQMPQDIEQVFEGVGLTLFPSKLGDLSTKCSCPDYANPCKHVAAVYYLLGEEFDRDPFLLFTLRGHTREELIDLLAEAGACADGFGVEIEPATTEQHRPPEPLSATLDTFWSGGGPLSAEAFGEVRISPVPAGLPKQLGGFPFWRGEEPFLEAIEPIYDRASPRGLEVFVGQMNTSASAGTNETQAVKPRPKARGRDRPRNPR